MKFILRKLSCFSCLEAAALQNYFFNIHIYANNLCSPRRHSGYSQKGVSPSPCGSMHWSFPMPQMWRDWKVDLESICGSLVNMLIVDIPSMYHHTVGICNFWTSFYNQNLLTNPSKFWLSDLFFLLYGQKSVNFQQTFSDSPTKFYIIQY